MTALEEFLNPATAPQRAVLQAAIEKAAQIFRTGTKAQLMRAIHNTPIAALQTCEPSWVTVTKRRIVIRIPLPRAKGEARFVLDRFAVAAEIERLWKKYDTKIVARLTGMDMATAAVEAAKTATRKRP